MSNLRHLRLLVPLALAASLASCQDIIEVDLPEGETRLIVNGRVTQKTPNGKGRFFSCILFKFLRQFFGLDRAQG